MIRLDRLTRRELEREAAGRAAPGRTRPQIPATEDYVGSEVVILGG